MLLKPLLSFARSGLLLANALVLSLPLALPAQAADTPSLTAEAFFKRSKLRGAKLSPSGRWLAVLTSAPKTRIGIAILDLEGKEAQRFIEASQQADVNWVEWVNEDWMVFTIEDPDQRSNEGRGSGLMAVRRDGSNSRMLIKRTYDGFYSSEDPFQGRKTLPANNHYIGLGVAGSNDVVIEEYKYDTFGNYSHSAFLNLNVATGGTRSLYQDGPRARGVLVDGTGKARVLWDNREGQTTMYWSDTGDAPWRQVSKAPTYESTFSPVYVDSAESLVVAGESQGGGVLRRFDVKTAKMVGEPLMRTPGFSMSAEPITVRGSAQVLGVRLHTDAASTAWFSPEMQRIQEAVDAKLAGRVNLLSCSPCDKPKAVLVESYADQQPLQYVLYRPQENRWQLIGDDRPDIDAARMAGVELLRTKSRDGGDLPIWVTRSAGNAKKAAPAVVLVHGGPYVRGSTWGWHSEAQFLASRGYVVIEPEFRGSTGYGYDHFKAGWKQWGLAMQDDITDALKFAVAQGMADPAKVCIVGGSYGGYAALMGLIKDPDQYRCGVAFAAVTDLRAIPQMFWSDINADYRDYGFPLLVGDLKKDAERLAATSPVEQAARIKAPVLLVHGGKDRRVPIDNGERMREALQKAGKKVEWVVYPDEGHGFARDENAVDYWKRVEAFLAQNLK
jgi:dipeptidyl aminopeptidase/acylaminoacyl peptidase